MNAIKFHSDFSRKLDIISQIPRGGNPRPTKCTFSNFGEVLQVSVNYWITSSKLSSIWKWGGAQTSPWLKSIIHSHLKGCGGPGSLLRWFKVCKCLSTWKVRAWLYYNVSNIWDEECIWENPLCHYHLLHDWTPLRKWASQTGLQEQIGKGYSVSLVWSLPTADKLWIFHRERWCTVFSVCFMTGSVSSKASSFSVIPYASIWNY